MAGNSRWPSFRPSLQYDFVRGRQLVGTFPGDKQTGVWPITGHRIRYGWGQPPEESWPYPLPDAVWPSIEPTGIDGIAKEYRFVPYKRVRTIDDCKRILLSGEPGVGVSLDISEKWANPSEGRIPVPSSTDLTFSTHAILLICYDRQRDEFSFRNSWGNWGRNGYGDIAAVFFWSGNSTLHSAVGKWQRRLKVLFDLAGVQGGHAHRFRDTYAFDMTHNGEMTLEELRQALGHKSTRTTERYYSHWIAERQKRLEDKQDRAWESQRAIQALYGNMDGGNQRCSSKLGLVGAVGIEPTTFGLKELR